MKIEIIYDDKTKDKGEIINKNINEVAEEINNFLNINIDVIFTKNVYTEMPKNNYELPVIIINEKVVSQNATIDKKEIRKLVLNNIFNKEKEE